MAEVDEISKEEIESEEIEKAGIFFSPQGFIMLSIAVFVDGGELLIEHIPYVGQFLSVLLDIFALVFIGGWMWLRSSTITVPQKTGTRIAKITKWTRRLKWLRPLCFIIELIPIFSSYLPLWILVVWLELKYS